MLTFVWLSYYYCPENHPKISRVKQWPFYVLLDSVGQEFRWGEAELACLRVPWGIRLKWLGLVCMSGSWNPLEAFSFTCQGLWVGWSSGCAQWDCWLQPPKCGLGFSVWLVGSERKCSKRDPPDGECSKRPRRKPQVAWEILQPHFCCTLLSHSRYKHAQFQGRGM